jgi:hypothetical protein
MGRRNRPRAAWAACVLALLMTALGACGGGSAPTGDARPQAPTAVATPSLAPTAAVTDFPTPTSTAAPLPTPTPLPPTPTPDGAFHAALLAAALDVGDLPAGFTRLPDEPADEDATGPCGHPRFERAGNKLDEIDVRFQASETGPFVLQNLVVFPPADALDAFAYARAAIDCTEWTEVDANGAPTTYRLAPLDAPAVGDDAFALRVELDLAAIGTLVTDTVFIRVGNVLSVVAYATLDAPDLEILATLAQRAAEKMAAVEAS